MKLIKEYIVLDLETTGLQLKEKIVDGQIKYPAEIIEIGITEIKNNKIGRNMSKLVKPKKSIPSKITAITGIDNEMVKNAKSIEDILSNFRKYLGDKTIITHNGKRFDIPLINYYLEKNNLPKITNVIDTLELLKNCGSYKGENNKLETACSFYHIKNTQAHRAYADTNATAQLFLKLSKENISLLI